ncbi:MAG: sigma factor [Fimbriimonadales bacterium]
MTATARMQLRWTGARSAASVALRSHAFRLALAIVNDRDLAEDVAQEAMIKLHQNPGVVAPEAWLRRVVTNLALNALRSQREVRLNWIAPPQTPGTRSGCRWNALSSGLAQSNAWSLPSR